VKQQNPAEGFPYRHSDFDYRVAWKTTAADNMVIIDGIMKNVRYPTINSIDLTVFLIGTDGKVRARITTLPFPQQTQGDTVVTFNAKLKDATLKPGDTFKFAIHYVAGEGGLDSGVEWNSTFTVDALTGAVLHKDNLKPEEW
jgi:hypothetical protein